MGKLNGMMITMMEKAKANPDKWYGCHLSKGLMINLVMTNNAYCLYLCRGNVYPSALEWDIVLRDMGFGHLPYHQKKAEGKYYLFGRLPVQESLF